MSILQRIVPGARLIRENASLTLITRYRTIRSSAIAKEEEKSVSRVRAAESEKCDEIDAKNVAEVIVNNTEITREHLTPEVGLHLLTPNCRLYDAPIAAQDDGTTDRRILDERRVFNDPFWSIYWPGGQALTRFVLDNGKELLAKDIKDTSFLDLGCGCGASAIAAKMIGASRVVANDIDEVACIAAKLNATLNGVHIEINSENLLKNRLREYESSLDVILVGDLLYDEEIAECLIPWLEETSGKNGSRIYLGDPGRHAFSEALKSRLELRETYSLPENVRRENYGYNTANVWQFKVL